MKIKKEIDKVAGELKELSTEQAKDIYGGGHYEFLKIDGETWLVYVEDRQ